MTPNDSFMRMLTEDEEPEPHIQAEPVPSNEYLNNVPNIPVTRSNPDEENNVRIPNDEHQAQTPIDNSHQRRTKPISSNEYPSHPGTK